MSSSDLLTIESLSVSFGQGRGFGRPKRLQAVRGVDLSIRDGEVLALVGESGSGKTTLGRALLRLIPADSGRILFDGTEISAMNARSLRPLRQEMQMIFQDPFASLDPRMTVGQIVAEGLDVHRLGDRQSRINRVAELLALVGLDPSHAWRYPHALSGGQRQRVGIARALAVNPRFIVADEPVSSLDVSVQAQIITLLMELKSRLGLTLLFITHNLGVVRMIADRVAVMYLGRIIELADTETLFREPRHPYTRILLESVPRPDPRIRASFPVQTGEPPNPSAPPSGCGYRNRCAHARDICAARIPLLDSHTATHRLACLRSDEII
ncbi:MAG: ABC transporter ATP-binding protein [Betaproteobacteria bacterium]|jgi:oligopeptide/dipeptide ABC transporter ATP-binding protein|nr:ABC transporter ATP-binding protein [Betaproteobacteria bacterium]